MMEGMDLCTGKICEDIQHRSDPQICLLLPVTSCLLSVNSVGNPFKFNKIMEKARMNDFFTYNRLNNQLQFLENEQCQYKQSLSQLQRGCAYGRITYASFFKNYTAISTTEDISIFTSKIQHVLLLPNKKLVQSLSSTEKSKNISQVSNLISRKKWIDFAKSSLHSSAKMVWYRLIHKKLPRKEKLYYTYGFIESPRCTMCNDIEDDKHLILSCPTKMDVWYSIFQHYFQLSHPVNVDHIYRNITKLNLQSFTLKEEFSIHTVINIIATTIRFIWKNHWLLHFEGIPFSE
ncbi:unnamed protein product [Mucor hiemalis]